MTPLKIVFFGTSFFAAEILEYLVAQGVTLQAIVTRPDKPRGRSQQMQPPPVKERAAFLCPNVPLYQPIKASTPLFVETLTPYGADLFVVVAYGEIIKEILLNLPHLGCINVHASLLPSYRGAAPMQRALMEGVLKTGVTIIDMVLEMDAGDILATAETPVSQEMSLGDLQEKLYTLACPLLLKTIEDFSNSNVVRLPQDNSKVTFAAKLTPEDERILWSRPAEQIHNQIRALSPQPGAWCLAGEGKEQKRFKIKKSAVVNNLIGIPGEPLSYGKEEWIVGCGEGALRLLEVQLEGKKVMPIRQFLLGNSSPLFLS